MNREQMRLRIADNLGLLSSNDVTIREGKVTIASINNRIDDIYREEMFGEISDRFPDDFVQVTYPFPTYTATGTVSTSSTGTTLISSSAMFDNTMEGFTVYNATDGARATIVTYTSGTQVTLDASIGDDWDGDTIYVLGNEYIFGGDATDLKEIVQVGVKYSATDNDFTIATQREYKDLFRSGDETGSKSTPVWYRTTIDVGGINKPAIGIFPWPDSYQGKVIMRYIEKPPALSDSTEPYLSLIGISNVIIYGVTAWGFRHMQQWEDADKYQALYEVYKKKTLGSYRPKNRQGSTKLRMGSTISNMINRNI